MDLRLFLHRIGIVLLGTLLQLKPPCVTSLGFTETIFMLYTTEYSWQVKNGARSNNG